MSGMLEGFLSARRPELASRLLAIIVPIAYSIYRNQNFSLESKREAIQAITKLWYLDKVKSEEEAVTRYNNQGCTVCIKCETVHGHSTAILRHCGNCRSHTLWNPLWWLDDIAEKTGAHPSQLETILSEHIRKKQSC